MFLIDTNIFLEILLEQEKSEECEQLLNYIEKSDEKFCVSSFTIHSIEVIMTRDDKKQVLIEFLEEMMESKIVRIETTTKDEIEILRIMKNTQLDFDDALQYFVCKKNNLTIISFDKHFDKTTLKRIEPKDTRHQ